MPSLSGGTLPIFWDNQHESGVLSMGDGLNIRCIHIASTLPNNWCDFSPSRLWVIPIGMPYGILVVPWYPSFSGSANSLIRIKWISKVTTKIEPITNQINLA